MADLTIDLGNYNTIITFREAREGVHALLPGVARKLQEFPGVLFVPSLVHMGQEVLLGEEVLHRGVYEDEATFCDLRDHASHPAPVGRKIRGRKITHKEAAAVLLSQLAERLSRDLGEGLNVVLLFPSFEGECYRDWLRSVDMAAARAVTLVDEDTAVALGYGLNLFADDLVMVFDFGFSSIRARVLQFHWLGRETYSAPVVKAAVNVPVGTASIKQKILRELHADEAEGPLPSFFWKKFVLHDYDAEHYSHEKFKELLERENLAIHVQKVIDRALEEALLAGTRKEHIRKVLLLGGGTRIPIVRCTLEENFGDRVLGHLPELAAGRGGVDFLSDRQVDDMVRHAYAIQTRDPISGEYHYPIVVEKYTRYPTRNPTARYIVNTFYDGQYELHLRVFRTGRVGESSGSREILYGDDGRISFVTSRTKDFHEPVTEPLAIPVHPPGKVGERRLLLEFWVDNQKRLVVTVRDLREDKILWQEKPLLELQ